MAFHIDVKYLKLVSSRIDGFVQKKPDLWNVRCFYCGDSLKKKSKKRGFFYKKNNDLFYRCFNCEVSTTFYKVLEYLDPSLCKEYSLERFSSGETKQHNYTKPKFNFKKPIFKSSEDIKLNIPSISSLDDKHYAKKYILERKIPKGYHKDLYYTKDFKQFVLEICPSYENELIDFDERIVIPFRDENGKLKMFQGRSLSKNPLRYITIKLDETFPKIYGLDRVNKKERIYILEAPLDSLFLKNSIAVADANLEFGAKYFSETNLDIVLIPDKEPRNKHIVKNIDKFIKNGYNVCLLPENLEGKDLNEFILNGITKPQLQRIIDENTFQGLRAQLEFNTWKKL